jgi:hypothetical protein
MNESLPKRRDIEAMIRDKLIELIRLSADHGIRIDALMYEALDLCDVEGPFFCS